MITIQLDKKEYEPGEQIQGKIAGLKSSKGVHWDIRLIWFTLGKGSRDFAIAANQLVTQPSSSGEFEFCFQAPDWPHSFSGELISLLWSIEVVELPSEEAAKIELVIAPERKEIQLPSESSSSKPSPLSNSQ